MLLKADKCWIQVHKNSSEGYERYLEKLKRMDGRELTDEVEEKRRDLEEGGTDAEIRFTLAKHVLAENGKR